MVRAAPCGLRFWLTVDQRTNDTLSVSAICEAYCSNMVIPAAKLCDSIRISFNRGKNVTPSPPIPRSAAPFCLLSEYPYRQITKDFAMRHEENYVELNGISIKPHQFVTNCPYLTKYSNHNICSYVFLLRFHKSFAGRFRNQIQTTWLWKTDT